MNWTTFLKRFDDVLDGTISSAPYDNPTYVEYVRLNASRQRRWMKTLSLSDQARAAIASITKTQHWFLITEDWCGDSAHCAPFIVAMAEENPLIQLEVILRDTPPMMIEDYLTNGGRAIPKLVVRDSEGKDLFNWGPRPLECQQLVNELKTQNIEIKDLKIELQKWYNQDKGEKIQQELVELIQQSL